MAGTLDDSAPSGSNVGLGVGDSVIEKNPEEDGGGGFSKAEVDTTAPFGSVKEAVTRFGGRGFWKPIQNKVKVFEAERCEMLKPDLDEVEQQAAELEKELIMKEKDALNVLKELESTKMILEELNSKLQVQAEQPAAAGLQETTYAQEDQRKQQDKLSSSPPPAAPGSVLLELKQAKLNLTRTTNDLADIRCWVESYNKKIEKERIALEKTRKRLSSSSSKTASVELELSRTRSQLKSAREGPADHGSTSSVVSEDVSAELKRLNSEAEKFKKMGDAAKSDMVTAMAEIEQTKTRIKTAEIRLVAAKKVQEAARATEAVALAEIKALGKSEMISDSDEAEGSIIRLSYEEYSSLTRKARDAEENSKKRIAGFMAEVEEANLSKCDILVRVEGVMEEVRTSKKTLVEALGRVEAADMAKLAVEEALRKWRSEHGQKRRLFYHSTKFKNSSSSSYASSSSSSHHRKEPQMLDVNGINMICDTTPSTAAPIMLKPSLSIGQILSQKLLVTEEFGIGSGSKNCVKKHISLGQILAEHNGYLSSSSWKLEKQHSSSGNKKFPAKRRKLGFARFSLLLALRNMKKKKSATPVAS
ncbi:hypothetical protein Dimus_006919 [Dionaea muscipula]